MLHFFSSSSASNVNTHWHELKHTHTTVPTQSDWPAQAELHVCACLARRGGMRSWFTACVNFIAAKKSFPRNRWHKLLLSHYLMTKHSHRLCFTLLAVAQEEPAGKKKKKKKTLHTCGRRTPLQIDPPPLARPKRSDTGPPAGSSLVRWLAAHGSTPHEWGSEPNKPSLPVFK